MFQALGWTQSPHILVAKNTGALCVGVTWGEVPTRTRSHTSPGRMQSRDSLSKK